MRFVMRRSWRHVIFILFISSPFTSMMMATISMQANNQVQSISDSTVQPWAMYVLMNVAFLVYLLMSFLPALLGDHIHIAWDSDNWNGYIFFPPRGFLVEFPLTGDYKHFSFRTAYCENQYCLQDFDAKYNYPFYSHWRFLLLIEPLSWLILPTPPWLLCVAL